MHNADIRVSPVALRMRSLGLTMKTNVHITEKDEDDIVNFGLKHGVDLIALSFARTAQDVRTCRDLLGPKGSNIKIICKIENQLGLTNYDEIL